MGDVSSLLRVVVSEMTYTVSSGTLNSSIPYHDTNEQEQKSEKSSWQQYVVLNSF